MVNLRDRVVIMLLFDQIVTEDQVALAWQVWRQMQLEGIREPLWRVLTAFPDVNGELIFAEAARVYGFEEVRLSRRKVVMEMQRAKQELPPAVWERMVQLRLFPVASTELPQTNQQRLVYATHDPARSDVQEMLKAQEEGTYELRYASEAKLLALLVEAFPRNARYAELQPGEPLADTGLERRVEQIAPAAETHTFAEADEETGVLRIDGELDRTKLINIFEDVLVEAVRSHASDICLLPNAAGRVEIYFQVRKQLKRWRVVEAVDAATLLSLIKRDIVKFELDAQDQTQKRLIQRWIDDHLIRFRVAALPASQDLHSESIVIRVLR